MTVYAIWSSLILGLMLGNSAFAAWQWPAGQPPIQNPVPQYRSKNETVAVTSKPAQSELPNFFDSTSARPDTTSPPIPSELGEVLVANPLAHLRMKSNALESTPEPTKPPNSFVPSPIESTTLPGSNSSPPRNNISPSPMSQPFEIRIPEPKRETKQDTRHTPKPFVKDFTVYRDRSPLPIDPRKPCQVCTEGKGERRCKILGTRGRPYQEKELGGCQCDSKHPWKNPDFSVHWPRPFSAKWDEGHPESAARRYSPCPQKRVVDVFDRLATFKLIDYQRKDNGFSGPDCDPYGCLGESKMARGIYR